MGAQQGPPAPDEAIIDKIVDFETALFAAQISGLVRRRTTRPACRSHDAVVRAVYELQNVMSGDLEEAGRFDMSDALAMSRML